MYEYMTKCRVSASSQGDVQKKQRDRYQDDLKRQIEEKKAKAEEEKRKQQQEDERYGHTQFWGDVVLTTGFSV